MVSVPPAGVLVPVFVLPLLNVFSCLPPCYATVCFCILHRAVAQHLLLERCLPFLDLHGPVYLYMPLFSVIEGTHYVPTPFYLPLSVLSRGRHGGIVS
jgi:hypothetical protein